jgi:hypothetical protein
MTKNYDKLIADKDEKWTKMTRALSQDVGRHIKYELFSKYLPKKIGYDPKIGKIVDLGKNCCDWLYDIIFIYEADEKRIIEAIEALFFCYSKNINVNTFPPFKAFIAAHFIPTLTKKISKFSQLAKLGFMDTLEKPKKIDKLKEGDDIQW